MSVTRIPSSHSDIVRELAKEYRKDNYRVLSQMEPFPDNAKEPEGEVDLLLEDRYSNTHRIVEATYTESLNPETIRESIYDNFKQCRKAENYFEPKLDSSRIITENVVGTSGDLRAINEIWKNTQGVFSWDQAVEAVSEPGRLGKIREDGHLTLNYSASEKEDEEYFEFSPELDEVVDIFLEYKTYP